MSQDTNPTPARTRGAASRIPEATRAEASEPATTPSQSSTIPSGNGLPPIMSTTPVDPVTFQQQILAMMNLLTQNLVNNQATNRQSSTPAPTIREPKSKDPETFHGIRHTLNAFLTECELVFELQPSRFQDDRTKVSYMISYLRDTPLLAIRPLLAETPRPAILDDYSAFVDHLRTNYGDPDEKGTARRKLKALRQVGPASTYFAEFQQYIAILGWKDQDPIIDKAVEGLKPTLKDEVARQGIVPKTLDELIMFIVPLDNRLYEREQERRKEKDTREVQVKPAQPRILNSNSTSQERRSGPPVRAFDRSQSSNTPEQGIRPMPNREQPRLDAPRFTRNPISDAERQRRRDHNLCLRCGRPGHRAVECTTYRSAENTTPTPVKNEENSANQPGNANGPPS